MIFKCWIKGDKMTIIKIANYGLAFLLEMSALFILGYWGFHLQADKTIRIFVGILAPLAMIVIWGIWCAPTSTHRLDGIWLLLIKCLIFAIVTYCLFSMKLTAFAVTFGFLVILHLGLSLYFKTLWWLQNESQNQKYLGSSRDSFPVISQGFSFWKLTDFAS